MRSSADLAQEQISSEIESSVLSFESSGTGKEPLLELLKLFLSSRLQRLQFVLYGQTIWHLVLLQMGFVVDSPGHSSAMSILNQSLMLLVLDERNGHDADDRVQLGKQAIISRLAHLCGLNMKPLITCDYSDEIVLQVIEKDFCRLSKLFGDGIVMRTLNEASIDSVAAGETLRVYFQGVALESGLKSLDDAG